MPRPRSTPTRRALPWLSALSALATLLSCTEPTDDDSTSRPPPPISPLAADPIVLAAGDIAGCDHEGDLLTAALIQSIPEATVLTLGDNAYERGTLADYTNCYEPGWGQFKARTRPALGNHEYQTGNANGSFDYFGDAAFGNSRPDGYYSFDLGAWHVVVLNDNPPKVAIGAGSAQYKWLRGDLSATRKECVLAVWHQPRFYSTYSGSPGVVSSRKPLWQLLYSARADLLLHGHHHFYERHAPQDPDGRASADGIRQIIVGTGGFDTWGTPTVPSPNTQVVHGGTQVFGVLKVTLSTQSYAWEFLPVGQNTFTDAGTETCRGSGASAAR
ncbi:MAG TPA: metallophosphoesterase, partial [Gemmatimonadales bacterium]|nr:metallophosphoesterase [Gemmatimonadales bacterium]